MEKKIGKNAKLLIASDLIYTLTAVFIETFLVAYFLKVTNENITKISIYYIIIYFLLSLGNVLLGKTIKKYPSKSQKILSLGIVSRALFILFIVILAEKIATNFILIAIIYGFSEILYWCAHELIYIDVTTNDNRKNYMSIKKILGKLVKIFAPIILGTSIELYSFTKIAIYVFGLSLIQIILTLLIKTETDNYKPKKYSFNNFLNYIKDNKLIKIKLYNLAGIAYGIIESSISTLIIVITIMTFKTSFNLGVLTTIFAICSMISLMLYNKFYNNKNSKLILILCSIIIVLGVLGLLIDINKTTLIIYNFCYIITFSIFDVLYNTRKGNLVKECNIENFREEYIGYTSISIGIGRIIGYILMLIVSFTAKLVFFKILLAIVTAFAPIYCYLIYKTENNKKTTYDTL